MLNKSHYLSSNGVSAWSICQSQLFHIPDNNYNHFIILHKEDIDTWNQFDYFNLGPM